VEFLHGNGEAKVLGAHLYRSAIFCRCHPSMSSPASTTLATNTILFEKKKVRCITEGPSLFSFVLPDFMKDKIFYVSIKGHLQ